jgi:hypothetical protein
MDTNNATQRKADKLTLVGLSATLGSILRDHREGSPVLASMAARIDERHALHMEGACQPDSCPLCMGTGITMDDLENI